jgi:hypothetical protein
MGSCRSRACTRKKSPFAPHLFHVQTSLPPQSPKVLPPSCLTLTAVTLCTDPLSRAPCAVHAAPRASHTDGAQADPVPCSGARARCACAQRGACLVPIWAAHSIAAVSHLSTNRCLSRAAKGSHIARPAARPAPRSEMAVPSGVPCRRGRRQASLGGAQLVMVSLSFSPSFVTAPPFVMR